MKRTAAGPFCLIGLVTIAQAQDKPPAPATPPTAIPQPDQTPIVDFPGQYAPRLPTEKFPVFSKGCARLDAVIERLACADFVLNDWPRLGRFAAANAALAPAKAGERRVVFFGDSITDNWSKAGYGGFFPGKPYVNRGHRRADHRADAGALPGRRDRPEAGGGGDPGRHQRRRGQQRTGHARDDPGQPHQHGRAGPGRTASRWCWPRCCPSPTTRGAPTATDHPHHGPPPRDAARAERLDGGLRAPQRARLLDYHAALADAAGALKPELNDDGLHPNAAGYAVMAPLAERAIARALGRAVSAQKDTSQGAASAP